MKRFASHYAYIPSLGFLKQYVVEINDDGYVAALYRLEEEIESLIWTPGVIRLMPCDCLPEKGNNEEAVKKEFADQLFTFDKREIKTDAPAECGDIESLKWVAFRLYPFDFSEMKANEHTTCRLLTHSVY
ncbi:MAG: hypothetical protein LBU44_05370 [Mediterranea sp.]|jgi:hypothetical protein|nr:hypothetical protein [Mediterranea sp.]